MLNCLNQSSSEQIHGIASTVTNRDLRQQVLEQTSFGSTLNYYEASYSIILVKRCQIRLPGPGADRLPGAEADLLMLGNQSGNKQTLCWVWAEP